MTATKQKHPIGLLLANLSTGLNSFYAYGVVGYVFLMMTLPATQNGMGLDVATASDIWGTYSMIAFMAPLVGGYLADRYLGLQKTIIIGTFVSIFLYLGYAFWLPKNPTITVLWTCFAIGITSSGLGKGNVSALVGELYQKNEMSRRDEAYSIFYMATNIGSMLGPIVVGFLVETYFATTNADGTVAYGFTYGFALAAALSVIQLIGFIFLAPRWLKDAGKYPSFKKTEVAKKDSGQKGFTKVEKGRIAAMLIIFVFVVFFWTAWYQTSTSFTLITEKMVDRNIFGFTMPITWLVSFNGFLCVVLAPVLGKLWMKLSATEKGDWSVITKLALGMIISGLAFVVLILGLQGLGGVVDGTVKMSIWYMLICYFLLTVGELMLSPIGMSLFNRLAPAKYSSFVMAFWYLSFSLANKISAKLTGMTANLGFETIFIYIAGAVIVFGGILLVIKPMLEKLMALNEE